MKPGYYLVTPDGERRFISARVDPAALDCMCDQYLTECTGWNYWVDRCIGLTIDYRPAWVNLDQSDRFYAAMEAEHG